MAGGGSDREVLHELLRTTFPMPLHENSLGIAPDKPMGRRTQHNTADGTEVIVASRWALQLDSRQQPIAVFETNNDVTERKRREDEIKGLNEALAKRARDSISNWQSGPRNSKRITRS